MKAKAKPSVGAKIAKFVLFWALPMVAVYFIGYKLIGPEIGKMPALDKKLQKVEKLIPAQVQPKVEKPKVEDEQATDDSPVATTDPDKAPVIDISVEKAGSKKVNDGQSRKKKKKKKAETPKADTQPRDEASGDGAMGGGDGPSDPAGGG